MGDLGRGRLAPFAEAVARGIHLAILREALEGLDRAEQAGTPPEEAGAALAERLRASWAPEGPRLLLTTENAAAQAVALGRLSVLTQPAAVKERPFWLFAAVLDDRISETCLECDGVLLSVGHPWWTGHICPLHVRCRSTVVAVTAAQAKQQGGPTPYPPTVEVEEGFGTLADLCSWEPRPGEYPAELLDLIPMADRFAHRLDLSPSDVHVPTPSPAARPLTPKQRRAAREAAKKAEADKAVGAAAVKAAGLNPARRRGLSMRIGLAQDGSHQIEVMHAADGGADGVTVRGEGCELSVLARDARPAPVWNQLTKLGAWRGHPAGPFEITRQTNAEILRNFRATQNQRIPIDFEHASEAEETSGTIPTEGAPAQAWIIDLEDRADVGLWGLVDFLEPARTYVIEKKYRYFSPAIRFGSRDRETGKPIGARMTSGGFTNSPFLDGLQPLAAADRLGVPMLDRPMLSSTFHADMRAALGLDGEATLDRCSAKCAELRDLCMSADDAMMSQGVDLAPRMMSLKALMGMANHSTLGDILDAVEEMIDAAMERHEATYHSTSDDDTGAMTASDTNHGAEEAQTIMTTVTATAIDPHALAVQLGEEKNRNTTLAADRDRLATEGAALSLRLKDAESRAAASAEALAARDAEIVALRDVAAKRDDAEVDARVEEAFSTYRASKLLSDDDKAAMRITLKADAALFGKLYPRVAPDQRHLLQPRTVGRMATAETTRAMGDGRTPGQQPRPARVLSVTEPSNLGEARTMSMGDLDTLTTKLMRDEGLNLMRASIKAGDIAEGRTANPYAS